MVQIISRGIAERNRTYEATCNRCSTKFSFERYEANYVCDPRDGDFLSIRCPLAACGNAVTVQANPKPFDPIAAEWGSLDR